MNQTGAALVDTTVSSRLDSLIDLRAAVEARLESLSPAPGSSHLADAVRYTLLAPGKRTRPVLTLLCARRFGGEVSDALDAACAFEMVHGASLAFDDLPCMDDARLRRGRPTTHVRFGEDAAVLAGVALLNEAYGVLGRCERLPDSVARRLVATLASAVGLEGLVGGQMRDLRETTGGTADTLETLNHAKTGTLFCAAGEAGAVIGGASPREVKAVCAFARHVGAAFQIRDDLLDGASAEVAGKDVRQDLNKPTFVSLLGLDGARRRLADHKAAAAAALDAIGGPGELGVFSDGMLAVDWLNTAGVGGRVPA